ncbi:isoamylase early set domain-containing protein [Streptomyces sp. CB03578]|uniref:isoamylase early set domain-containing protein n=1 Tax=Streptomyces sp. CB03578 TaxID=1718987 RepID=UPI000B1D41A8|nr:isoamylase early set domain-containing protein [Streptomyces sp. CB03578]
MSTFPLRRNAGGSPVTEDGRTPPARAVRSRFPRLERKPRKDRTEVTFVLPTGAPPGPVSVVGDFNNWQPGVHTLEPRKDGKRAVTIALPSAGTHSFRYLAAGDYWFNDESAADQDWPNSRAHT